MTREKLEYYRMMHQQGTITKDEFRDIVRTYENQDRSFLELGGRPEVPPKTRIESYSDDPYAHTDRAKKKQKGFAGMLSEIGDNLEKSFKALENQSKTQLSMNDLMKLLKEGNKRK